MASHASQKLFSEARKGDIRAQVALGHLYLNGGGGLGRNQRAAFVWLLRAYKKGDAEAGLLLAEGVAPEHLEELPIEYLEACKVASESGSTNATIALGDCYLSGRLGGANVRAAADAYLLAAQKGSVSAARKLGLILLDSGHALDVEKFSSAENWLKLAADQGDSEAKRNLADHFWRLRSRDAVRWLESEAESGDAESMFRVGELLYTDTDRPTATRGVYWLERAARRGHGRALWRYGRLHVRGLEVCGAYVSHSLLQASRLIERAVALGVTEGTWDLARIYQTQRFSKRDVRRARLYLEQAALGGVPEAQLELGRRLARRNKDREAWIDAGRWLTLAVSKMDDGKAESILRKISATAPVRSEGIQRQQDQILAVLRPTSPKVVARLALAAAFGLNKRETLFIDPCGADAGWCLNVDVSKRFSYAPWRLIGIQSERQRDALDMAVRTFRTNYTLDPDLTGTTTRERARRLESILRPLEVDAALFVEGWRAPSGQEAIAQIAEA